MAHETAPPRVPARRARLWADLALLLVAAVWGSAFVAQRTAMDQQAGPFRFTALRFALGAAILLPLVNWRWLAERATASPPPRPNRRAEWRTGLFLGLLLFAGATLQQVGLVETTAGKGGFITSLYVVVVPLLLTLARAVVPRCVKQRVGWGVWLGAGLSTAGLYLLSVQPGSLFRLAPGDGWVLLGTLAWALHMIGLGWLAPGKNPLRLAFVQYTVCAALSAVLSLAVERGSWDALWRAWPSVLYTGGLSIGLGYTLQVLAQQHTPADHTAIILSLESAFAALAGWLVLDEVMSLRMGVGAVLMLLGMLAAQTLGRKERPARGADCPPGAGE